MLVDENVPRSVMDFFARANVECIESRKTMHAGALDYDLAKAAHARRLAIITCDKDFKQRWEKSRAKTPDVRGLVLFEDCTHPAGFCEQRANDALGVLDHEFARARQVGVHPFVIVRRSRIVLTR